MVIGEGFGGQIDATLGQAAARGQFALFDKGRALARWYQRHGAGSKVRVKGFASRGVRYSSFVISPMTQQ
jgi:hypothetical protein